jgi:hypothetical protein
MPSVRLHRCLLTFVHNDIDACWKVQKALDDQGIAYEVVPGPWRPKNRAVVIEGPGQPLYPAIRFDDGSWYREESKEMARAIAEGRLMEQQCRVVESGGRESA